MGKYTSHMDSLSRLKCIEILVVQFVESAFRKKLPMDPKHEGEKKIVFSRLGLGEKMTWREYIYV